MGWEPSTIISNKREAEGMRVIEIQASDLIAESYISAGQYVQIKKDGGKPGFYAMASPPDKRNIFTFLVKESEANAFLLDTKDGEKTEVSLAQGKGFQITEYLDKNYKFDFPVSNVLLMACGSGLAPIAAAIESGTLGLKETNFNSLFERRATLYLGARTLEHLPFAAKFAAWEELGVTVIPVLSKPSSDKYDGRSGYIQDALAKDTVKVPKNTAALLCGQR
jgi:NAD(P)H-flavin reductase